MQLISFYNYYKIGRFIFALTLFISFHILYKIPTFLIILVIYVFIAFIRLFVRNKNVYYTDFILDIMLISYIVYLNINAYSFLTLFYLIPIFLASILIKSGKFFLFPVIASLMYILSLYFSGLFFLDETILNILLHSMSFFIISFAGNAMKEKLEKQEVYIKRLEEEKIRMESYKRLYRVSADLAHELRNPLATISATAQLLREGKNDPELVDMLSEETKRLTNLANDFLLFSRPAEAPQEDVDITDALKILVSHKDSAKKVILETENNVFVLGNRTYLEVALNNIIKNAIEASRSAVIISVKKEKHNVIIDIEDDGPGIDENVKEQIFEPFFTTKKTGTGLGLAISNRIINGYGGSIMFDKSPVGGAKFTVMLPVAQEVQYANIIS